MSRTFVLSNNLLFDQAGFTSRNLSSYMLNNATLSSWKHFYHKPYAFDWKEATQKAMKRVNYEKDEEIKNVEEGELNIQSIQ